MSERSWVLNDFCTSQCHLHLGPRDIPSAPLFISKGKVVCAVFLNLKSSYSLPHLKHAVFRKKKKKGFLHSLRVALIWFLWQDIILKYLCVFYNILFIAWDNILAPASAEELSRISAKWDVRGKIWYSWYSHESIVISFFALDIALDIALFLSCGLINFAAGMHAVDCCTTLSI